MIDRRSPAVSGQPGRPRSARDDRRRWYCVAILSLILALGVTIACPPLPRLVWNASASAPIGLYTVSPGVAVTRGDMVIARVPARWRDLAARRRYIPANVPLVKRVAAGPGDRVCAIHGQIHINGHGVAAQHRMDGRSRIMPRWHGCMILSDGAVFLLMDAPDSFDGRYFGPTAPGDIIGKARLLWRA